MKRIPLLLTALGVVSAAAYAAPELTVTNFGQSIETENVSNGDYDIDDIWLWNTVGLKYGDWSYNLTAGKHWSANFDHEKEIDSTNHRLQFDAWRKINDDLKLGFRYRGQKDFDRFVARYDYAHGMLWSSGDFWYQFNNNNKDDRMEMEWFPLGVKVGALKVGYFVNYWKEATEVKDGVQEDYIDHQIRAYAPVYDGEKLDLSTELRVSIKDEKGYKGKAPAHRNFDDFGRIRLYLKANYAMTENLDLYGTIGYGMRDYKMENGYPDDHTEKYYSNVVVGYNYKF